MGSVLVPKLLKNGYRVKVLDLYIYGEYVLKEARKNPGLTEVKGDIRDRSLLEKEIPGTDAVIHLACISNDPSYELNPFLGKSINYEAFKPLMDIARKNTVKRFIYASSSSVYGIKKEKDVTEDMPLEPLTDYSKYKALCERILLDAASDDFVVTVIRPSTVCGYSPRLRLDLTVNILTNSAINKGKITLFGGKQMRPNIHIKDMTDLYVFLLEQDGQKIQKKIYNAGYQNYRVSEIAEIVRNSLGNNIPVVTIPHNDHRSYHVCSRRIKEDLGFKAGHSVKEAVLDLKDAFQSGSIPDPLNDSRYYNVRRMQKLNLE